MSPPDPPTPEKILIIRLSSIGDIVLTTPVIRALRQKYPDISIDYMIKSEFRDLVAFHPGIESVRTIPQRFGVRDLLLLREQIQRVGEYDWIVDLHDNLRSRVLTMRGQTPCTRYEKNRFHRWLFVYWKIRTPEIEPYITDRYFDALTPLAVEDDGKGPDLYFPEDFSFQDPEVAREVDTFRQAGFPVTVAPGAAWKTKQWPVDRFAALCGELIEKYGATIALLGGLDEQSLGEKIVSYLDSTPSIHNFIGKTSLLESAKIVEQTDIHIGNDSGLTHIATAFNKRVVLILGSTAKPICFYPKFTEHTIVEDPNLRCRPCTHMGRKRCPLGHFRCMENLQVPRVIEGVERMMKL